MNYEKTEPMIPDVYGDNNYSIYEYKYCRDIHDKIYYSKGDEEFRKELLQYTPTKAANHNLAGDIAKELEIEDKSIIDRFGEMMCKHLSVYLNQKVTSIDVKNPNPSILENSLWINYMRPNEYNPKHNHAGMISFVWYLDIPEEIREEWKNSTSNTANRGCIQFFSQFLPNHDMTFNPKTNDLFIFDALHSHQVYPYYSDNTRISLAGNIWEYKYEQQ